LLMVDLTWPFGLALDALGADLVALDRVLDGLGDKSRLTSGKFYARVKTLFASQIKQRTSTHPLLGSLAESGKTSGKSSLYDTVFGFAFPDNNSKTEEGNAWCRKLASVVFTILHWQWFRDQSIAALDVDAIIQSVRDDAIATFSVDEILTALSDESIKECDVPNILALLDAPFITRLGLAEHMEPLRRRLFASCLPGLPDHGVRERQDTHTASRVASAPGLADRTDIRF